jgi:high-affinity nickel permease
VHRRAGNPGLLADKLQLSGGVWDVVAMLNDNLAHFGYFVVALFALTWATVRRHLQVETF